MAFVTYVNKVFPGTVGGPGPWDVVQLTVTAGATSTPVLAQTDLVAYNAASDANKALHDRFSDVVMFFHRYAEPVSITTNGATGTVISLYFERAGMFSDSSLGKAPYFYSSGNRPNAYDIATEYVAVNTNGTTAIAVTVNGVAQTA